MTAEPPTRAATCPQCGHSFRRTVATFQGREIFAGLPVLCCVCSEASRLTEQQGRAEAMWQRIWQRMPCGYRNADATLVRPALRPVLSWTPESYPSGVGIIGASGMGKSCALACLIRFCRRPFLWLSGTSARQAHYDSATGETAEALADTWRRMHTVPLLVIDDIGQCKFSEAWGAALFSLMEARTSARLPTLWTCQVPLPELRAKIGDQTGDHAQAEAISRRLAQHSLVITLCGTKNAD